MDYEVVAKNEKYYSIILLLLSTTTLISLKWLVSYFFFSSEPLINKIIFDLEDHYYFAYIIN